MKTTLRLSIFALTLSATTVLAQPTITSATAGGVGDVFSISTVNVEAFDPGPSGAGVTWDFSGITLTGATTSYTYVNPATTPYADDFPDANVAAEQGGGIYSYYKITSSEWSLQGLYPATLSMVYSDPEVLMNFPMSYGDTFSDDFFCNYFAGYETNRDGSVTVEADAYGTLILPDGSYDNVLRVVLYETVSEEFIGLPYTSDYEITNYFYLREGTKGPLFQYSYFEMGGPFPSTSENASINNLIGAVGVENNVADNTISLFPNPAQSIAIVDTRNLQADVIEIYDLSGRIVLQSNPSAQSYSTIDISSLAEGTYIVRVVSAAATYSNTLQVIH